jgi:Cu(I)/Ag(I) efflux system membrane protein CusA/SilA
MKPLATPVLGGMISSLAHVLIVTPVIFLWIHERRLGLHRAEPASIPGPRRGRSMVAAAGAAVVVASIALGAHVWRRAGPGEPPAGVVVQTVKAQDLDIVLLSSSGTLKGGRNAFTIEFRSPDGRRVDVGVVHGTANMSMPGMVMSSGLMVKATGIPGRYAATADFGMAGAWPIRLEWNGPAGQGAASFEGTVQ